MTIARWTPRVAPSRQEQFLLKRLDRVRKLLGFLRLHRHELFDDAFQDELTSMYRNTGAGKEARPPAMMAMAMLVQGYLGISDAEMIELTVVDLRVQMVLGCLGAEEPAFSQGALQEFRDRLITADLDRRVLERTVELAKRTQAFDHRQLPKTLRVAIDSSPLEGAGRVEDTFNLLAHAARNVVRCAARLLGWTDEQVCTQAGIPLLVESSIKRALDIDWNDVVEKAQAIIEHKLAHISQRQGNGARYASASARTRSTSVARARSKTWRHSIVQKSIHERLRNDVTFKPVGAEALFLYGANRALCIGVAVGRAKRNLINPLAAQ